MLNIVTIHAIRKTPSLSKNLKTLLLSQAISDLGVGLLVQPIFVAQLVVESTQDNESSNSYNVIYIARLITTSFFYFATLLIVIVLCAERFASIHFYLRYQELTTYRRVVAVVVSIWVFSGLISLIRLFISKKIMYLVFGVIDSACVTAASFFSARIYLSVRRHLNEFHGGHLQVQPASHDRQMASVLRLRKFAIMAIYVYLVLVLCYLPDICLLLVNAFTPGSSTVTNNLLYYTVTLGFLNSSLNPLIYCWRLKHIRHTTISILRNAFSKHNWAGNFQNIPDVNKTTLKSDLTKHKT